jgi:hypothetical protein
MKHFKGGTSYKSLRTSALDSRCCGLRLLIVKAGDSPPTVADKNVYIISTSFSLLHGVVLTAPFLLVKIRAGIECLFKLELYR